MRLQALLLALAIFSISNTSLAQSQQVVFYGGIQESPHSTVRHAGERFGAGWEGKPLQTPIYYGLRYTRWADDNTGWSVNFAHSKAYADDKTKRNNGYQTLEFTDGSNPLTLNRLFRFDSIRGWDPYLGVGAGVSIPHVEIIKSDGTKGRHWGFQYGGPVLRFSAGISHPITNHWNWFAEYDFHYLMLNVKHEDGRLKTNLIHNALNLGIGYTF